MPYSAIVGYAAWNGLSSADDFECLLQCVRAMDAVYLEIVNDPDKEERDVVHDEPLTPAMLKAGLGRV